MKTISFNILSRIKVFITLKSFNDKQSSTANKSPQSNAVSVVDKALQASALETFQRKAYMGHFMAGPIAFLHPGLLQQDKR